MDSICSARPFVRMCLPGMCFADAFTTGPNETLQFVTCVTKADRAPPGVNSTCDLLCPSNSRVQSRTGKQQEVAYK